MDASNEHVIFPEEGYQHRRNSYNHGVDTIPHDFLRFGPTGMEGPLREILRATDDWAYVERIDGKDWPRRT